MGYVIVVLSAAVDAGHHIEKSVQLSLDAGLALVSCLWQLVHSSTASITALVQP